MGSLIGLAGGIGFALVWLARIDPRTERRSRVRFDPLSPLLVSAGVTRIGAQSLLFLCLVTGLIAAGSGLALTEVPTVAVLFGVAGGWAPIAALRSRAARRIREHAEVWPDAVDNLASAIRAGLSLPESLIQLGERGPEQLRPSFRQFGRDYRATGRFDESLDMLKVRLADPVADRVIEGLRIAREVGGGDVGRMLRSLASFLRDDLRTRGELESRQSWTVNGARLAVAAPWLVLLAMSGQSDGLQPFASRDGAIVLGGGAAACLLAFRSMLRIGRLPGERRVLA